MQPNPRRFVDRKHISRIVLSVTSIYTRSRPISGDDEAVFSSGFMGLIPLGLTEQALDVFRDMRGYSSLLQKYCCGEAPTCTRIEMIDMRNAVQHRLVFLPLGSDRNHMTMQQPGIYECCRLTALLYTCAVTFPLPPSMGWDGNLVRGIKQTLENLSLESWPIYCSDFHLWVLVLAGIAAFQKSESRGLLTSSEILLGGNGCLTEARCYDIKILLVDGHGLWSGAGSAYGTKSRAGHRRAVLRRMASLL